MAPESSRARPSPVTDSSPSPGWDPYASEERVAAPDAKPGCATQTEAVERSWSEAITRVAAGGLGGAASTGFTEPAQRAEPTDHSVGPGRRACCAGAPTSVPARDATRGRSHHGLGLCNHDGGCNPLPAWQAGGQLPGSNPERAQLQ